MGGGNGRKGKRVNWSVCKINENVINKKRKEIFVCDKYEKVSEKRGVWSFKRFTSLREKQKC